MHKNTGLKTLFDIRSEKQAEGGYTLLLEIGRDYGSYAFLHKPGHAIDRIQFVSFDAMESEKNVQSLLETLQQESFESVVVCSGFPQALLFPHKLYDGQTSSLDLVYDQPAQAYFHDTIPEWQMVNAYAMPDAICSLLTETFDTVHYLHAYTPAIKIYNGYVADHQVSVHFTEHDFRVLLKKDRNVHLAQTYAYRTPLDVIYYLLKICYEFGLSQQDLSLILSGLVEKDSHLFTDLQQYFTNIQFAQQPEIRLPDNPHPHYFFTSLYNLAACVS